MIRDDEPLLRPWAVAAIWLALAALFTTSQAAVLAVKREDIPLLWSFWWGGAEWLLYALLSPAVFALARRRPLTRATLRTNLPWLLLGWLLFHLTSQLLYTLGDVTLQIEADPAWPRQFGPTLAIYLSKKAAFTLIVFAGMLTVAHLGRLIRTVRDREREAAQLEAALTRSRLEVLKGQLQPHFLFNTLNTVASLVHDDPEAAERVLAQLGDLLRLSLQSGEAGEVTLAREVEFLERYVEIQRVRFADRLTVHLDIAPDARRALLPTFLLQPLVENAIRHGIEPRAVAGTVIVRAARAGDRLRLEVTDDGVGIGPDGSNGRATNGHGVGLSNTRQRLGQMYGPDHEMLVEPARGGGTTVRITIPWREAGDG